MTQYVEYEGKNLDKALEKAGQELNQNAKDLIYDVVSYGSTGIFGIVGAKKARIRVKINAGKPGNEIQNEAKIEAKNLVNDAFNLEETESPELASQKTEKKELDEGELDKAVSVGQEALAKIIHHITEGADISVEKQSDRLLFKVDGGNSAILIGKRGQTLEAIQYLVEKIINKQTDQRIRVLVDVKGYLGARKVNLKKLAARMAEKVQKTNKPVTVGQMNAYERRIVHMSLKDNHEVRTQSMGEGYYRKLVIFPKKKRNRRGPRSAGK